jgi:DNA-binding MarR family transcriptional regulator
VAGAHDPAEATLVASGTPREDGFTKADYEALARFRYGLRMYLRFSERAVRLVGLTPQQYQLMLAIKGFPGRDWATVTELSERLQSSHNSVVGLIDRTEANGFVERQSHPNDRRSVAVHLTEAGQELLTRLVGTHREELERLSELLHVPPLRHTDGAGQQA